MSRILSTGLRVSLAADTRNAEPAINEPSIVKPCRYKWRYGSNDSPRTRFDNQSQILWFERAVIRLSSRWRRADPQSAQRTAVEKSALPRSTCTDWFVCHHQTSCVPVQTRGVSDGKPATCLSFGRVTLRLTSRPTIGLAWVARYYLPCVFAPVVYRARFCTTSHPTTN